MTRTARLAAVALLAAALVPACTRPTAVRQTEEQSRVTENPWPRAAAVLRKEADLVAARRVLAQLSSDLSLSQDPALQPQGLAPDIAATLQKVLNLSPDELDEVRPATFTGLDANYLAECLYLRDVARSLEPQAHPPARQAQMAFEWVCRQLTLHPWELLVQQPNGQQALEQGVVPVSYALRRGSGSGLERSYLFLGLARQMGFDACLIGTAASASRPAAEPYSPTASPKPRGPFWAVGARVGGDILLFDPWRGEPLPGPDGTVATLAQVTTNPDLLKSWREDKERPWTVPPEDVKASTVYLAVPLSSLAPRMKRLEKELSGEAAVRLTTDPIALQQRFRTEAKQSTAAFWNPPGDPSAYSRVLRTFLPREEGGHAPDKTMLDLYRSTLLPTSLFPIHPLLLDQAPEAVERIHLRAVSEFYALFLNPPTPREQVQRGQFAEVTPGLVERRQHFIAARERVRTDRDRESTIREFAEKSSEIFSGLARARGASRPDPGAVAEAQQAVTQFWTQQEVTVRALVDLAVAQAGYAEATYLLAQCMHEQAERAQARYTAAKNNPAHAASVERFREKAGYAWSEARTWWSNYDEVAATQEKAFPGRTAHSRRLADRAAEKLSSLGSR